MDHLQRKVPFRNGGSLLWCRPGEPELRQMESADILLWYTCHTYFLFPPMHYPRKKNPDIPEVPGAFRRQTARYMFHPVLD